MDADGQHDPADLTKFLETYQSGGIDLIIGRRSFDEIPFPRNFANSFGSWLLSQILRVRIFDNQSGYRLYSDRLLRQLEMRHEGFEFEVDVILQALNHGFVIEWVDIRTIYADEIKSHFHPILDTIKFFKVAWLAYRTSRSLPRT
jgi:glycosyltransferase involved in cell wall biosynthesis